MTDTLAIGCVVQKLIILLVPNNILCNSLHLIAVDDSRKVDIVKNSDAVSSFCKFLVFCRNNLAIKILKMKSTLSLVLFHLCSLESCLAS